MRSKTLKWILLLSTVIIVIIIGVQLYWLNKVYKFEEREFNNNVVKSVRGLFEDIDIADYPGTQLQKLIDHPDLNTFIIEIDSIPPKDSLSHFLISEFEDFEVLSDCKMALYDVGSKKYLYQLYLPTAASLNPRETQIDLPELELDHSYIYLYFPHRRQYIVQKLGWWISATILLFLVLLALPATLFYLYKQKTLNELQKDFVNNFTHEFKTPLAVMKLASDVLVGPAILNQPDRLKQYSLIIKQQTEHLQYQVERLLKTATTDENFLTLEKTNFDPNDMISEVITQLDPLIKMKNAKIDLQLDPKYVVISADKPHISLVVVNLVENAIKYSEQPLVIISTSAQNGHFTLSVKDNGVGIKKEYLKHIFRKFYRIPTGDVHNVKGFGLGLNFVKKVVDAHHGKITVNSIPEIGTEFKIVLPKL
ncbi:sensor histidine kinase [Pinibacter soli]|uniref:histidine kinase n=1 Tax=Pinibacter soli TaxID=3044211 RepID=A0ABT6RJ44_9BACT|nr:HAMP domain-containing sensor histidine kinase [Pinibacter soli]MDI3322446.1 HAMP domain-containing sensor histidine kinase [Pinibacter soli]